MQALIVPNRDEQSPMVLYFCTVSGSEMPGPRSSGFENSFTKRLIYASEMARCASTLVYFQNFTNTHDKVVIRERHEQAINEPGVVGINIGTRPDCLPDETWSPSRATERYACILISLQTTWRSD